MDDEHKQEKGKLPVVDFTSGSDTESDLNYTSEDDEITTVKNPESSKVETSKRRWVLIYNFFSPYITLKYNFLRHPIWTKFVLRICLIFIIIITCQKFMLTLTTPEKHQHYINTRVLNFFIVNSGPSLRSLIYPLFFQRVFWFNLYHYNNSVLCFYSVVSHNQHVF